MYTFEDGSGRSLTLRPEGTAPVCRAYVEHGMHKLRQPVSLWYLSSFFRHERAQAGRYRQFWQVGAEALGSEDPAVDAESICLLWTLLERDGRRPGTAAPLESRQPRGPSGVPRAVAGPPARARRGPVRGRARAYRAEPAARVRLRTPRHPSGACERPPAAGLPRRAGRRALRRGSRLPGRRRRRLRDRPHARTRPGLLHAHGLRAHLRCARRAERRRRRRPLRRPGRDARRPCHPRHRLGRRSRAHPARGRFAHSRARTRRPVRRL